MSSNRLRTPSVSRVLILTLGLAALSLPATRAQNAVPSRQELRQELLGVYQSLQTDVRHLDLVLVRQLRGNLHRAEVVDRYLEYLPMSPLDFLEIDMCQKRYEHVVPSFIEAWHDRWIELHTVEARRMYGAAYVDERLSRGRDREEEEAPEAAQAVVKATVGTNRNVAATFGIEPEGYQGEIQLAVNPNDPNELVAAANTQDSMGGDCGDLGLQAVFYSSDGGQSWGYTCPRARRTTSASRSSPSRSSRSSSSTGSWTRGPTSTSTTVVRDRSWCRKAPTR